MKKTTTFSLTLVLILSMTTIGTAQLSPKRMLELAEGYQSVGRFAEALDTYQKYQAATTVSNDILINIGICLFETNQVQQARSAFESLVSNNRKPNPLVFWYLAQIFHEQGAFQEAAVNYKLFLKSVSDTDPKRPEAIVELRRCANGIHLSYLRSGASVENMGSNINSVYDEFGAIQSPNNPDRIYFSSAREGNIGGLRTAEGLRDDAKGYYSSDMYSSKVEEERWGKAIVFNTLLNSPREDILGDFSSDGKKLYFFRGATPTSGQMLVDTFKAAEERNLVSTEMMTPMDALKGDRDLFMFNDSVCMFSSNRDGGQGGYDLYVSLYIRKRWTAPINLGPAINTPFDEVSPMLAADGRTLFYSSDNTTSTGGFDVFKSKFSDADRWWATPVNMGTPINSPSDDTHLRISRDGSFGFLTSSRKEGFGKRDIYYVTFHNSLVEQNTTSSPASFIEVILRPKNNSGATQPSNPVAGGGKPTEPTPVKVVEPKPVIRIEEPEVTSETKTETTSEVYLKTLNYSGDGDIANPQMMAELSNMATVLKENPSLHLVLSGHSDPTGSPTHIDAYLVMKRVEKLSTALIKAGVPAENILLRSFGSSYPRALNKVNGAPNTAGQLLNRRIETFVYSNTQPIKTIRDTTMLSSSMSDPAFGQLQRRSLGLTYRVQVAAVKSIYEGPDINEYPDILVESQAVEGTYFYSIGIYPEFKAAETMRRELETKGFEKTNINAYLNGVPITIEEARRSTLAFPDLFNYIGYKSKN